MMKPTLPDLREISMGHGIAADALLPALTEMARLFCLRSESGRSEANPESFESVQRSG
jgi:hypothetical protein